MEIIHPHSESLRCSRDQLLQVTLRPPQPYCEIAAEYPIVLSSQHQNLSYCLVDEDQLKAHANLWPRNLFDQQQQKSYQVGLIGNVATDPQWQGQGLMKELFKHLHQEAKNLGLDALILWSDLRQFYQKLGFRSLGQELRIVFEREKLNSFFEKQKKRQFLPTAPANVDQEKFKAMLALRHDVRATLERSYEEFKQLLTIPETTIYNAGAFDSAFAIVGKGYDMVGVVHEWGAKQPEMLLNALNDIANDQGCEDIMLLSPNNLPKSWLEALAPQAKEVQKHDMALACPLHKDQKLKHALAACFIWGLDSI